jgi:hypothetical protein
MQWGCEYDTLEGSFNLNTWDGDYHYDQPFFSVRRIPYGDPLPDLRDNTTHDIRITHSGQLYIIQAWYSPYIPYHQQIVAQMIQSIAFNSYPHGGF